MLAFTNYLQRRKAEKQRCKEENASVEMKQLQVKYEKATKQVGDLTTVLKMEDDAYKSRCFDEFLNRDRVKKNFDIHKVRKSSYFRRSVAEQLAMPIPLLGFRTVQILVGPNKVPFAFFRDMLCHHSIWFNDCFNSGNYIEGETGVLHLPQYQPPIFELVHRFVRTYPNLPNGHLFELETYDDVAIEERETLRRRLVNRPNISDKAVEGLLRNFEVENKKAFRRVMIIVNTLLKFHMPVAADAAYEWLAKIMKEAKTTDYVTGKDIEMVCWAYDTGHRMRTLIVEIAMIHAMETPGGQNAYSLQEKTARGFAAEMLSAFRAARDPSGKARSRFGINARACPL